MQNTQHILICNVAAFSPILLSTFYPR